MEELKEHRACLCVDGKKQGSRFYLQNEYNCVAETGRRKDSREENPRKCSIDGPRGHFFLLKKNFLQSFIVGTRVKQPVSVETS